MWLLISLMNKKMEQFYIYFISACLWYCFIVSLKSALLPIILTLSGYAVLTDIKGQKTVLLQNLFHETV